MSCNRFQGEEDIPLKSSQVDQDALFLQVPAGRRYVRSFLFTRRIGAPFSELHLLTRILLILCLSLAQLRAINVAPFDPVAACFFWAFSLVIFLGAGMPWRTARFYILLILPALLSIFLSWTLFNPVPGRLTLVNVPVYSGHIVLGFAVWQVIWLAIAGGYFLWRRGLFLGIVLATAITLLVTNLWSLPSWPLVSIPFFHPLALYISDQGLLFAFVKVIGYSGMMLATIALVTSSRDAELIGLLRQLRVPQPVVFFVSTVFRALDLALTDYQTIRQAQVARAIHARPSSFIRLLRNLASTAVPMVAVMIRRSSEIGDALQARGYGITRRYEPFYEVQPLRPLDWAALLVCAILLFLTFGPRLHLTTWLLQLL